MIKTNNDKEQVEADNFKIGFEVGVGVGVGFGPVQLPTY